MEFSMKIPQISKKSSTIRYSPLSIQEQTSTLLLSSRKNIFNHLPIYLKISQKISQFKIPKTIRYSPISIPEMWIAVERGKGGRLRHGNVRIAQPLAFFIV